MTDQRTLVERLRAPGALMLDERQTREEAADAIEQAEARIGDVEDERDLAEARIAELQAQLGRDRSLDVAMRYETYGRLETRLRKAERLAEAVEYLLPTVVTNPNHPINVALRSFRTTEDAK